MASQAPEPKYVVLTYAQLESALAFVHQAEIARGIVQEDFKVLTPGLERLATTLAHARAALIPDGSVNFFDVMAWLRQKQAAGGALFEPIQVEGLGREGVARMKEETAEVILVPRMAEAKEAKHVLKLEGATERLKDNEVALLIALGGVTASASEALGIPVSQLHVRVRMPTGRSGGFTLTCE